MVAPLVVGAEGGGGAGVLGDGCPPVSTALHEGSRGWPESRAHGAGLGKGGGGLNS